MIRIVVEDWGREAGALQVILARDEDGERGEHDPPYLIVE